MLDPFNEPDVIRRQRRLPHWTAAGGTYFITFRLAAGRLTADEVLLVRGHIAAGHERFYRLAAAVVMPDHVHLLLQPADGYTLSRVMQGLKGDSARRVNAARGAAGPVWQAESWDRIVRDEAEFEEKWGYMLGNPVRAGLATEGAAYPGWWANPGFDPSALPVPAVGQDSGLPGSRGRPESCPTANPPGRPGDGS